MESIKKGKTLLDVLPFFIANDTDWVLRFAY